MTPSKLTLFNCLKDAAAGAASKDEKHFREWLKSQDPE